MTKSNRPNILWISFEDTIPLYGCYGDPVARTPNLDRLAAEGCRFTNAFSTAPVCAPTRSAIITGMYPISIGTHHMRTWHNYNIPGLLPSYEAVPPHYVKCFTEYLRAAGYFCSNNSKTDYQFATPLTAWDSLSETAHWRERPDPQQPFFAVFNPMNTHESSQWPENTPEITFDPNEMIVPPYFPDTAKVREAIARVYTQIEASDRYLGLLLQQLADDGLADNTIVMHWSDHGPMPRGKRWPYDTGIHVPLITRGIPGSVAGSVSDRMISTIDLGPTVLSLANIPIPHHMQGRAFAGPQEAPEREYIFVSRDRYDISYDKVRAVRDRRFKYIRHDCPELPYMVWNSYCNRHPIMAELWRCHLEGSLEGPQKLLFEARPIEELYDTASDPHEIDNLALQPQHQPTLERLRAAIRDWTNRVGDLGEVDEVAMLHSWYPAGRQPQTGPVNQIVVAANSIGSEIITGGNFQAPILVTLHCGTQGASIAWSLEEGDNAHWSLYTQPIRLSEAGVYRLRTRAIRIGYKESIEQVAVYELTP